MCTTYLYTYVHPDGRREQVSRPTLCNAARYGQVCVDNVVLQHPPQYVPSPFSSSLPTSYTGHFPPSPPHYTPRSGTPNYRSGDDSDRSYHSSSSNRRRSGVYINGQRVLDLNRRDRDRHSRRERIVLVDNPPTPRTPPQTFNFPHTAPSSPNARASLPYIVDASPRESSSRRPVIVDERPRAERPRVQIEVVDQSRRSSKHARHSSSSSHDSRPSYTSAEEEEFRQRRREREAIRQDRRVRDAQEKEAREKAARDARMRQRIAEANAEIDNRPAVPMPPLPRRASTFVAAKAAREARDRESELIDAVRRLDIEEKRRGEKRAERDEDEAQRARLRERMVPRRRASVGPGSRRHRVLYDDGVYRWE